MVDVNIGSSKILKLYKILLTFVYKIECFFIDFIIITTKKIMEHNQVEIFIPFLEKNISKTFIFNVFEQRLFGKIVKIEIHDKKIKNKKNNIRSAKHNYAFATIHLFDTMPGNNLRKNIMQNKTTYVICEHYNETIYWQVKPYLNVEDRLEKGFNLHIDESSELMINAKKNLSLVIPDESIVYKPLHQGQMAPRNTIVSFFDNLMEKMSIWEDYLDIENAIDNERINYQKSLEIQNMNEIV